MYSEIRDNLESVVNGASDARSLLLYSGHDVTVVAAWRALGLGELLEPEYGASLVFELHQLSEDNTFFVKVLILDC